METATNDRSKLKTSMSDLEMRMEREFEAPRQLVWKAFTKREHLEKWWGPFGAATRVDLLDLKEGGKWRFVEKDQESAKAFHGSFSKVDAPNELSYSFEFEGLPGHVLISTQTFEEMGGKTKVVSVAEFESKMDHHATMQAGAVEGLEESYLKLDKLLAELQQSGRKS